MPPPRRPATILSTSAIGSISGTAPRGRRSETRLQLPHDRLALPGGQELRQVVRERRQPGGDLALALLGLEQLVRDVERGQDRRFVRLHDGTLRQHFLEGLVHVGRHVPGVLRWQIGPHRVLVAPDHHLDGARAPARQLLRYVPEDRLELVEHRSISPLSVVRQAHPPEQRAPVPAPRPLPPRAACAPGRGRSSATRRRADRPESRAHDTRRTPRGARAAGPRPAAAPRPPAPRSPPPPAPAPRRARPAAAPGADDTAPAPGPSAPSGLRARTAEPPTPGHPRRGGQPNPAPPHHPVPPPATPPPRRLPVPRYSRGRRALPLTQSGTSSPICPYQVVSHPRTSAAAAGLR